jgi:hypothetical protein
VRYLALLVLLTACEGSEGNETQANDTSNDSGSGAGECVSNSFWTGGNEESSKMHPGMDCIACHARGEGPTYKAAGTVFTALHEPDDCNGLSGVTVELTDANGVVHTANTNSAGNFSFDRSESIAMPYSARVFDSSGLESAMSAHQSDGACNSCHTVNGKNSAPGRISLQ